MVEIRGKRGLDTVYALCSIYMSTQQSNERLDTDPLAFIYESTLLCLRFRHMIEKLRVFGSDARKVFCTVPSSSILINE